MMKQVNEKYKSQKRLVGLEINPRLRLQCVCIVRIPRAKRARPRVGHIEKVYSAHAFKNGRDNLPNETEPAGNFAR